MIAIGFISDNDESNIYSQLIWTPLGTLQRLFCQKNWPDCAWKWTVQQCKLDWNEKRTLMRYLKRVLWKSPGGSSKNISTSVTSCKYSEQIRQHNSFRRKLHPDNLINYSRSAKANIITSLILSNNTKTAQLSQIRCRLVPRDQYLEKFRAKLGIEVFMEPTVN